MTSVSVVVPTRDRLGDVTRLLRALEQQEPVDGLFEVIVVADGCTDATVPRLQGTVWPFPLHVLDQSASGPATARNCGAALASGRLLLFLDDDVEPERGMLRAHVTFHETHQDAIGIGYLPPLIEQGGFLGMSLRGWWESMFDGLRRPDHRYWYKDLLSGHFSIPAARFHALGGFDASLRCHEDYEFGYRAIRSGSTLQFLPDAVAWHGDTSDLAKVFRRKFEEGVADVRLAQIHADLIPSLPLSWRLPEGRAARALIGCAWDHPRLGDWLAARVSSSLPRYERWRLRFRWRARLEALLVYWYWRGVASVVGTRARLAALVAEAPPPSPAELVIDLSLGPRHAGELLDEKRPRSARLVFGSHDIGTIQDLPGGERLRGVHLGRLIARDFAGAYLRAAAAEGCAPPPIAAAILQGLPPLDRSRQACAA